MLQLNVQPAESQDQRDDGSLDVHSVFFTLQGECIFAGRPAVFVRLAGCTLCCPSCDTEYTQGRSRFSLEELLKHVGTVSRNVASLVVLTGGEPFRQNVGPLVRRLVAAGYQVQVETNGTVVPKQFPWDSMIVCSPKTPTVHKDVVPYVHHWKYVLSADEVDPNDGLPTRSLGMSQPPYRPSPLMLERVWVQPMDSGDPDQNKRNLQAAVDSCLKYGYRLAYQIHKECELP